MARGINKVILVATLGADPEVRYMPSGGAVANFSVATNKEWKDKTTGEKKSKTNWHKCVAFNRLGEIAGEYLRKGSMVYLEGESETRKYQDKDGRDCYITEVIVRELQMLDSKRDTSNDHNNAPAMGQQQAPTYSEDMPDFTDDIPY